jgi:hypothetical protein
VEHPAMTEAMPPSTKPLTPITVFVKKSETLNESKELKRWVGIDFVKRIYREYKTCDLFCFCDLREYVM